MKRLIAWILCLALLGGCGGNPAADLAIESEPVTGGVEESSAVQPIARAEETSEEAEASEPLGSGAFAADGEAIDAEVEGLVLDLLGLYYESVGAPCTVRSRGAHPALFGDSGRSSRRPIGRSGAIWSGCAGCRRPICRCSTIGMS